MLQGPKIGPMLVADLAIGSPDRVARVLPVAVDVQVRKVSEYLRMTDTGGADLEGVRSTIQQVWRIDVEARGAVGPEPLDGTAPP